MHRDYVYIFDRDCWMHPESKCTITGEDMPEELIPEVPIHLTVVGAS